MERNENGFSEFNFTRNSVGQTRRDGCGGGAQSRNPVKAQNANDMQCTEHQLAMVYAPHQCWRMLYAVDKALMRGTLFEELDKPLEDCVNG